VIAKLGEPKSDPEKAQSRNATWSFGSFLDASFGCPGDSCSGEEVGWEREKGLGGLELKSGHARGQQKKKYAVQGKK